MCGSLGCQHKCQASPTGGTCYCPEGRILANDSRMCIGKLSNYKNLFSKLKSSPYFSVSRSRRMLRVGLLRTAVREHGWLVHMSLRARLYSSWTQQVSCSEHLCLGTSACSGPRDMAIERHWRGSQNNRKHHRRQWSRLSLLAKFALLERHEDAKGTLGTF